VGCSVCLWGRALCHHNSSKSKPDTSHSVTLLCAFYGTSCKLSFLLQAENLKSNRYPEVLPYDHARVVLNDLANISGSDYINASTIVSYSVLTSPSWTVRYIFYLFHIDKTTNANFRANINL
jgi:protein tyrosine phosphatase